MDFNTTAVIITKTETGKDKGQRATYSEQRSQPIAVIAWPCSSSGTVGSSVENVNNEDIVTDGLSVSFPHGTVIPADAEVEILLDVYSVQGNAFAWKSPFDGSTPGVTVTLKKVA